MSDEGPPVADKKEGRDRFLYGEVTELLRATNAFEHAALRPPFLMNGGAVVVYLALYGTIITSESAAVRDSISTPLAIAAMAIWIVGLIAGASAVAFGYYSQFNFRKDGSAQIQGAWAQEDGHTGKAGTHRAKAEEYGNKAHRQRQCAECGWAVSIGCFVFGVILAILSILQLANGPEPL